MHKSRFVGQESNCLLKHNLFSSPTFQDALDDLGQKIHSLIPTAQIGHLKKAVAKLFGDCERKDEPVSEGFSTRSKQFVCICVFGQTNDSISFSRFRATVAMALD